MPERNPTDLCPPHYWEITSIRIDGICYYHHYCLKCHMEKDIPLAATASGRWVTRETKSKG
ncbi:MAG: hypothetical protein M1136_02645 [Chloroflexi bacterium]|nr:hypothetical protein [Chloroflexota bacterium]MCL5074537.1 hypothetical protein [Chloroflexota bacterium]